MSLYSTGFFIRRFIILFLIFIGLLISLGIIGTLTGRLTKVFETTKYEQPSLGYGSIPITPIKTVSQADIFKPSQFIQDTSSGKLPNFAASFKKTNDDLGLVNVYKYDLPPIDASARLQGGTIAQALEFTGQPEFLNNNLTYVWSDSKRKLTYNADSRTFDLATSNITQLDTPAENPLDLNSVESVVTNMVNKFNVSFSDSPFYLKKDYVKYDSGVWQLSPSDTPTNFIRVSFMRYTKTRNNLPLPTTIPTQTPSSLGNNLIADPQIVKEYYTNFDYSPMYMVIKTDNTSTASNIIEIKFNKYNYDITKPHTYNYKTTEEAYNDLVSGNGYLVSLRTSYDKINNTTKVDYDKVDSSILSTISSVKIKNVELGYYYNDDKNSLVLPIYVFTTEFVISQSGLNQKVGQAVYYVYAYKN